MDKRNEDLDLTLLRQRVRLLLAFEEATIVALSETLARHPDAYTSEQLVECRSDIRSHRVGIIRQRAILGAVGIDV